ncbi:MAG: putative sulfate exporter family transporter [Candidatus Peregrinibacteria bacterium]|nr:putative sulfate exporter family transporter [Candidatus Peregrinibacteria bacterium]
MLERFKILFIEGWKGFLFAVFVGTTSYLICDSIQSPLVDVLLVSLLLGMVIRTMFCDCCTDLVKGFYLAPLVFIPVGVILYGAVNLKFGLITEVKASLIFLLLAIVAVYFSVILWLGKILKLKKKITYLIATGSAICGASAITITTPAVDADPEDVSISLISIFIVALVGLFIIVPVLEKLFGLSAETYAVLSGMIFQFTGFVKASVSKLPEELAGLALSIKATRYMVLLVSIPFFASLTRNKIRTPWFLWAFLASGFAAFYFPSVIEPLIPTFKPLLGIVWSIALVGIGLTADIRAVWSQDGIKALGVAFGGFLAAITVFLFLVSAIINH